MKLHKFLVENRIGSQKYCETLIKEGRVEVNGLICTDPTKIIEPSNDIVTIEGKKLTPIPLIYVLLNKPKNFLSQYNLQYKNIYNLLPTHFHNLYPVGRLDKESEGLIIMTNDGKLNHYISNPANNVLKTYWLRVDSYLQPQHIEKLCKGTFLSCGKTRPIRIRIIKRSRSFTICIVTIFEGKNREIRRIFAKYGYKIKSLKRIAIGRITLQSIPVGCYKVVNYEYILNRL